MTEANSYPLRIDGMDEIPTGAFRGHLWARPSVQHLRELMRRVKVCVRYLTFVLTHSSG